MGVVYRAHDERLDRDVALKVLPAGSLSDDDARRRFRKEALALSKLNHPHIATIHDFDSQGGIDFLVMELISGQALSHVIRDGGLSDSEVRDLSLQLADGLVALHGHGIVHRDLKPGNLRLTADGRLKILDFGLARLLQPVTGETTVTSTGTNEFAGTLPYMAPEQVRGEAIDARTDVYAAGAVMYELATGRQLFPSWRGAEHVTAILNQAPQKPKAINPQLSDSLEHVILSALSKDRTTRLSSSVDLQKALRHVGLPPKARPGARRTARIAAVAAAIAIVLGAVWYLPRLRSKQVQPATKIVVAVLPFPALAVSQQARFLGVGIPDAIITRLAGLQQLIPRPTSAVLKYENESVDAKDAGKALASDYVLTGILQEANERLRVSVQLVRAQDVAPMWGDHYDVMRSDLLTLQDQIAQSVADALKIQMTAAERDRLFRRYTENGAAYERYLRGRAQFSRYSAESLREAVDIFESELKLDQYYAQASAGVALASAFLGLRFAPASESRAWNERAAREAKAALEIDPQLAEAHEALAAVYRAVEFEWERALEESRQALALNPHLDQPRLYRAAAFYHLGLLDLVEPELQAAAATLNPDPANQVETLRTRGITALLAGRYQDALSSFEDVQRVSGGTAFNYLRGLARYYTGDAKAAEEILALRGTTRGDRRAQAGLASLLARRRAGSEARALVQAILEGGYTDHHIAYSLGATYAQLGEFPEAVRWLSDASRTGLPCYPWYVRDPLLDPLRNDHAFQQILERLQGSWQTLFARYKSGPI